MSEEGGIPDNVPIVESEPLRENLITTAIKFLQNPKVQSSPLPQKKDFLKRKGLTEEEIQAAVERAGVTESSVQPVVSGDQQYVQPQVQTIVPTRQVSTWEKIRDYSALAIIVGGVVYGLYTLYKRYIEPLILQRTTKMDKRLCDMDEGIKEMNSGMQKSIKDLQSVIKDLQEQITDQTLQISQVSNNVAVYKAEGSNPPMSNTAINELQAEITTVKGLLLSTKQFPATPVNPPVIPSWQLKPSIVEAEVTEPTQNKEYGLTEIPEVTDTPQKRIDLEETESLNDDTPSESENQYSNMNGHSSHNGATENGIVSPPSLNGMATNLHNSMLVSPVKLGNLNSSNEAPQPLGGESELD
uniref:Peroxisomal membrane protein PEX14 n=1 Tax=Phallusia mammillata TaxID=59560 RepID=A0A6F9DP81_9ASCI|nr:peroxisomal membrane protein PEX14-like [Phallusia mammillata]